MPRFSCWGSMSLPREENDPPPEDVVEFYDWLGKNQGWPIVDNETSGPIEGYPRIDQMLCICPSPERQTEVVRLLRIAHGLDVDEDWKDL